MEIDAVFPDPLLRTNSLRRVIAQVEEAMQLTHEEMKHPESRLAFHLRADALLAFECTYELCEKMLRRFLKLSESGQT